MPIKDPFKLRLAQYHKLFMKVCMKCGARNALSADKCRKCKSKRLRLKKRERKR
ncbi:50S ribosomal protein L40e [archaeon]|nr:MAG: 50S ribosomal protein L40e [archaeon]RLG65228.1 MAG: 50S ribosomal protein L40e [archaeon]RLG66729.1 MAG: 50S ribosomal protein L40e [archaeon]HDM24188.1 50S ribosomal protein L40e [Candidatus Bathyarchaeota archaeon]